MAFDPTALMPLLGLLGNNSNNSPDTEKLTGLFKALNTGDFSPILELLGADEKTRSLLNLARVLPSIMSSTNSSVKTAANPEPPKINPLNTVANAEISQALKRLLGK